MNNLNPTLRLHKPPPVRRADSCLEAEALQLLWSWAQAWRRVHPHRKGTVTRSSYGPDFTGKRDFEVPPLVRPCDCDQPVQCVTDGHGGLLQECKRCGASNTVTRRHGLAIVEDGGTP